VLAAIDFHALGQVIWVSLAAGVSVTVLFSVVVFASDRADESRRDGAGGQAAAFGALAVIALVVFLGSVVYGVVVMLKKS
jgi:uncharacterized membrane protein